MGAGSAPRALPGTDPCRVVEEAANSAKPWPISIVARFITTHTRRNGRLKVAQLH